tara:strand:- start:32924 stop:33436 length:513 start_codon:yes stop_codon:yes gene_type:complete
MSQFESKEIAKPFHLKLKEYQKLFPEFKARGQSLVVVALNPLKRLSGIISNTSNKQQEAELMKKAVAHNGFMVISVTDEVKDIKAGDLVLMTDKDAMDYALIRQMVVKDVFPRVREYTMMIFGAHNVKALLAVDPDMVTYVTNKVNVSVEEQQYQEYLKELETTESNVNL